MKDCHKVFEEQKSGTSDQPPRLKACLDYVRPGDTLVVTRLDRLARSTLHLCQIVDKLQDQQVDLQVIDQNIDTSDATGRLLFHVLSAISQFETELRSGRQIDGIAKAKERGVRFGQQKRLTELQVAALQARRKDRERIRELMTGYGLSKATVCRYLNQEINSGT